MRSDVTLNLKQALAAPTVAPLRLLLITLPDGAELRFHNSNTSIDWSGDLFDKTFEGGATREQAGGGQESSVRLDTSIYVNDRPELAPQFNDADARKSKVKLWEGVKDDLVLIFDGEITSYSMADGWISCDLRSALNSVIDVRIAPPFVQVATPPGTIVQIGGETVVIEGGS